MFYWFLQKHRNFAYLQIGKLLLQKRMRLVKIVPRHCRRFMCSFFCAFDISADLVKSFSSGDNCQLRFMSLRPPMNAYSLHQPALVNFRRSECFPGSLPTFWAGARISDNYVLIWRIAIISLAMFCALVTIRLCAWTVT